MEDNRMTLRWNCDQHGCLKNILPDWSFLNRNGQEMVTDMDGIINRMHYDNQLLVIEYKTVHSMTINMSPQELSGKWIISGGQRVTLQVMKAHQQIDVLRLMGSKVLAHSWNWNEWSFINEPALAEKVHRWYEGKEWR
jgi:hypothetical protein